MIARSLLLLLLLLPGAQADDAVIVGGGYALQASQGQIELNVKWVQQILESGERDIKVFYTDGADPAMDVTVLLPETAENSHEDVLERVFSSPWRHRAAYHTHTVPRVSGSTGAGELESSLKSIISDLTGDTLFVYNGHGAQSPTDLSRVSLMLWRDTRMPVSKLHALLENMDAAASFRYVFTQCYSGGFHRLIYADAARGSRLHAGQRCGFTAESAYRLAEGCSSSINTEDYRDYTTFFFAALSGQDRNGQALTHDPDSNGDGSTTLREAHFYTLQSAVSTDLPRASSEQYLSTWQPWYVRWLPQPAELPNNEYTELHNALLVQHGIADDGDTVAATRKKLSGSQREYRQALAEQQALVGQVSALQSSMRQTLTGLYPDLLRPYADQFAHFNEEQRQQAEAWLLAHPEFDRLVELQAELSRQERTVLEAERKATQMQKILRMRKLATLKDYLYRYGSKREVAQYERLVSCEDSPL